MALCRWLWVSGIEGPAGGRKPRGSARRGAWGRDGMIRKQHGNHLPGPGARAGKPQQKSALRAGTRDALVVPPNFTGAQARQTRCGPVTGPGRASLSSFRREGCFGAGSRVVFACLVPRFQPVARALWGAAGYSSRSEPVWSLVVGGTMSAGAECSTRCGGAGGTNLRAWYTDDSALGRLAQMVRALR